MNAIPHPEIAVALWIAAYFVGAIPFGVIIGRAIGGADPRSGGSGNIGATNVLRTGGRIAGALTLALDAAKGAAPVLIGVFCALAPWQLAMIAVTTVIGHVYPVYLRFKGGKGVATAAGAFLALVPIATLGAFLLWVVTLKLWGRVSLASLVAAGALPALIYLYYSNFTLVGAALGIAFLIVGRHKDNIARLIDGEEPPPEITGKPPAEG